MIEPLWDDERIVEECADAFDAVGDGYAPALMRTMRDEYEEHLAQLTKQLDAMAERYRQVNNFYWSNQD